MTTEAAGIAALLSAKLPHLRAAETTAYPELEQERLEAIAASEAAISTRDDRTLPAAARAIEAWLEQYRLRYVKSHTTYQAVACEIATAVAEADARSGSAAPALDAYRAIVPCPLTARDVDAALSQSCRFQAAGTSDPPAAFSQSCRFQAAGTSGPPDPNLPVCPACGFRLGDRHPRGEALRAAAALQAAAP